MSCSLSHLATPLPTFASATLRHGRALRAEHEWFHADANRAGGIDLPDAHMLVLADECIAARDYEALERLVLEHLLG